MNITSFHPDSVEYTVTHTVNDACGSASSEEKTVAVAAESNLASEVVLYSYQEGLNR